jgi:hypothetical protein
VGSRSCTHAGEDTMAASGESCRDSGHGFLSLFDPNLSSGQAPGCTRQSYNYDPVVTIVSHSP